MRHNKHIALAVSIIFLLTGVSCRTIDTPKTTGVFDDLAGKHRAAEARLATDAAQAMQEGKTTEALIRYEQLYKKSIPTFFKDEKERSTVAVNYAQLLRKTGKSERALEILAPYAEGRGGKVKRNADPMVLNEYSAALIEQDRLTEAEKILNQVLEDGSASEYHADAYNLLGIVLDAQGKHTEAEQSFHQALDGWKGDKTSVMNNLAICQAAQGKFDEALLTLRQALVMAPKKEVVAHNIQLITDLRQAVLPQPPQPLRTNP